MREFTYVKKGVFLYEFKTSQHYDDDPPRRLYDISGAKVYPLEGSYDPERAFRVVTRSSEGQWSSLVPHFLSFLIVVVAEIDFVAENPDEKKKWFDSLSSTVERTSFMSCAALIAPVRRRQSSVSYTSKSGFFLFRALFEMLGFNSLSFDFLLRAVKKKNMKVICLVKISDKGIIKEFDKATTLMYEMKDEELMGQSVKILFNADAGSRFLDHVKDYMVRLFFLPFIISSSLFSHFSDFV